MLHRPLYRRKAGYSFIRSLNPAAWFRADTGVTVTGLGASTWADQSGNGRDLLQSTDASRPPYLSYSGTKYLYLPGASGNFAAAPDSVANSITGDIDIRVRVSINAWSTNTGFIAAKYGAAGAISWGLYGDGLGKLVFRWSTDGTATITKTSTATMASAGVADGAAAWIRVTLDVDNGAAGNDVKFYTAADSADEPTGWTQLGSTVTTVSATSIFDSASAVTIGASATGGSAAAGRAYRATIKNGIDGTTVVDFNPDLDGSDQAATITSSATGEVWTINQSGGLPAQIVGRPSLLFDGTADYLKCNAFTLNQPETVYIAFKQVSWTASDYVFDGDAQNTFALAQTTGSPKLSLYAGTNSGDNSNLAVGSYGVLCGVASGANSVFQINNTTAITGNFGLANMGGFTLGARGTPVLFYGNIQVLEVLIFSTAHDATQRARVIQYLAGRAGISL